MMYKKLVIDAPRGEIESVMGRFFKYPKLYKPNAIIDGADEALLPIITMQNPEEISYGIWGLLPAEYHDDWRHFQDVLQTLHSTIEDLEHKKIFNTSFKNERCLIIVTGFFIYHLHNGTLYPYYVHTENQTPFCLAGLYTTLQDGFITTTMLMTEASGIIEKIQNLESLMPVPISEKFYNSWLAKDIGLEELRHILGDTDQISLKAHPIDKDFFKNNIHYSGMLDPAYYDNIPIL